MNSPFSLGRLASGLPKVGLPKITVRHGSKKPRPDPVSIKPKTPPPPFDPSYGERIYAFQHTRANHVIYSHTKIIKANKALRQIPFNGKKLRPTTIRKDYWRPLAMIEFAEGNGEVGRSVFQKLREFRKRHELEWEDPEMKKMDKKERGKVLNDQKGNSIADMAAVLGGAGKGNKVWVSEEAEARAKAAALNPVEEVEAEEETEGEEKKVEEVEPKVEEATVEETKPVEAEIKAADAQTEGKEVAEGAEGKEVAEGEEGAEGKEGEEKVEKEEPKEESPLHEATIYWMHEVDQAYAQSWPATVKHVLGLPWEKDGKPVQAQEVVLEDAVVEQAATEEKQQTPA